MVFPFKKKQKQPDLVAVWPQRMTDFYQQSQLTEVLASQPTEVLTYGLGYFSALLRAEGVKDKLIPELELACLQQNNYLTQSDAVDLQQRIRRSTSNIEPLLAQLVFYGLETYHIGDASELLLRGQQVQVMIQEGLASETAELE